MIFLTFDHYDEIVTVQTGFDIKQNKPILKLVQ